MGYVDLCRLVKIKNLFFFFLIFSSPVFCRELEVIRRDIEKDISRVRIVPGLDIQSSSQRRGILLYKHPSFSPFFHFHFSTSHIKNTGRIADSETSEALRPELHISLGSLSGSISFFKYFRYSLGLEFFTGGELVRLVKDKIRDDHSRPFSLELFTGLEFQPLEWLQVGVGLQKELIEHRGLHGLVSSGLQVFKWQSIEKEIMNAWIHGELGFANISHNRYIYGSGAGSGLSHYGLEINFEWPKVFWDISFGNSIRYSGLLVKNRHASLVSGHPDYLSLGLSIKRPL